MSNRPWILLLTTLVIDTAMSRHVFADVVEKGMINWVEATVTVVFFVLNFFALATILCHGIGFFVLGRREQDEEMPTSAITTRTAIAIPIYHEDPIRVRDGIKTIWSSICAENLQNHCDLFLLSDSNDRELVRAENMAADQLVAWFETQPKSAGKFTILRRLDRRGYKAGNISQFLEKIGHQYDFGLLLDADSILFGSCLKRLILKLQMRPRTAILQAMTLPIHGRTFYARLWHFSLWRTTPLFIAGLHWVMTKRSVYWGHNALIRIKPFMDHASLPLLPGKQPFGGPIMSQDIVEAALLARAGWNVEWDIQPQGSFDEIPAHVISYAKRDHRWCQGNFQHFWIMLAKDVQILHRLYFAYGIITYAAAPILIGMMALGHLYCWQHPPESPWKFTPWLMITCLPLLQMIPKALGMLHWGNRGTSMAKNVLSTFLDIALTSLIFPLLMFLYTRFVLSILAGHKIEWGGQSRNVDEAISWKLALRQFSLCTVFGWSWAIIAIQTAPEFLLHAWPVILGWMLSVPIAVFSSKRFLGDTAEKYGLLALPTDPEDVSSLRNNGLW